MSIRFVKERGAIRALMVAIAGILPVFAGNPPPTQVFYVPFPEDQQLAAFDSINAVANDPITVFVTLSAATDGTVIYYDHWEDGYERDITNPVQSTTLIFGDGNTTNGYPPGNAGDLVSAGTVFNLRNFVTTSTLQSVVDYDARDKIASFKPISVTKMAFPDGTDTLLAGCVEVFEQGLWGTEYRSPVGVNMPTSTASGNLTYDENLFSYAALTISAGAGGASVQIDKDNSGNFEETVVLAEGEVVFRDSVNVGGRVLADKPVQVVLFTGTVGSTYASRDTSLLPVYRWSSDYYAPVSTRISPADGTVTYLYNPGATAITVNYDYRSTTSAYTSASISVPAGGNARVLLTPADATHSGAYRFYTTGASPPVFYAVSAIDADAASGSNQNWDGGFTLVGKPSLTTQVLVSLGIGRDPYSATAPGENGNPVWVTTVGNGHVQETVYVDYNGDNAGPLTDPNGNKHDVVFTPRELDQLKIYDPDGDQSGMLVYTLNPAVKIAAVWGQDPAAASVAQPGLDVASLVPPLREGNAGKKSTISVDADGDGHVSAGDTLEYDIRTVSDARTNIPGPFGIQDNLPADTTYVAGSTRYRFTVGGVWQPWVGVPDDGSGTAFPLDGGGFYVSGNLGSGQQLQVLFEAVVDHYADLSGSTIVNTGIVEISPYGLVIPVNWTDTLYGSIGDRVWNDLDGDGIQDSGEAGISGVAVYADLNNNSSRDAGEPWDSTDSNGNYLLTGMLAGTYTVRVNPSDIAAANVGYGPTYDLDGLVTSHVTTVTLLSAQDRFDADFGYRVGASVGDRVWMDRDADGAQEAGEPGVNGVRVYVDVNNNNAYDSGEPNTITSGDGVYNIGNLAAGTYNVRVDTTTLPSGATQTFDLTGALDHEAAVTLIAAEHKGNLDFGYRGTQSIGDLVWEDVDANGVVTSSNTNYNVINGRVDLNGDGSSDGNDDGFIASMRIINGYVDNDNDNSTPVDNDDDGTFLGVTIVNGGFDINNSGGISNSDDGTVTYSVSEVGIPNARVFIDFNSNGLPDATEPSAVTNASGIYSIGNLFNGNYAVRIDTTTLPTSYVQTYDLTNPSDDHAATVTLSGTSRTDVDFGYRNAASLGDLVWNDRDGDGTRDAGEPALEGVLVYIDADGDNIFDQGAERFALTDITGYYHFDNLAAGSYAVRIEISTLPQGCTQTYDLDGGLDHEALRTLTVTEAATNVDFGYRASASFGDYVWNDSDGDGVQDGGEAGISGVRVYLDINGNNVFDSATEPAAVTDSSGAYLIGNLVPGTYTARVDTSALPSGLLQTYDTNGALDHAATFSLAATQARTDIDFGYTAPASIGDFVWSDVDGDGQQDGGEPGIPNVTVTLHNAANDAVVGTDTTDASGLYSFGNLYPGNYYVIFDAVLGYQRTPANLGVDATDSDASATTGRTSNAALVGGQSNLTLDAGYYQPAAITGTVFADSDNNNSGDVAIPGVILTLKDSAGNDIDSDSVTAGVQPTATTTNASGVYTFGNLPPGSYRVVQTQPAGYLTVTDGDTTTPGDDAVNASTTDNLIPVSVIAGETDTGNNFIEELPGTISGTVFADTNNDNTGDVGIAGVTLTLNSDPNGDGNPADGVVVGSPFVTLTGGAYSFTNLAPGSYVVVQTQPAGYLTVTDGDTTTPGDDAANASTTDNRIPASVIAGETDTGNNFIEEQPATITGHLYIDSNGNGVQNGGEPNLANVDVLITDSNLVSQTVTTNSSGNWTVSVPPGSTTANVQESDPQYPTGYTQTQGNDPTTVNALTGIATDGGIDGYFLPGSISGTVLADTDGDTDGDVPLAGVVIRLMNSLGAPVLNGLGDPVTATTLPNGTYGFGGLPPGSYRVYQDQPAGYASVSDTDGTNNNGIGDEIPIVVTAGNNNGGNDFIEIQLGVISGYVLLDTDNNGSGDAPLSGVVLNLLNGSGNPVLDGFGAPIQVSSGAGGFYSFTLVPAGSYQVSQNQPATYGSVSDVDGANNNVIGDETPIVMTPGLTVTNRNFVEIALGAIRGFVFDDTDANGSGDAPFAGVTLSLLDGSGQPVLDGSNQPVTTLTAANGSYRFDDLFPGDYQVAETQPSGYGSVSDVDGGNLDLIGNIAPISVPPGGTVTGRNFIEVELGSISGFVLVGLNPLAGVTLTLLDSAGNPVDGNPDLPGTQLVTAVTDSNGHYTFIGVIPGNYQVAQTQPPGYDSFGDLDGGDIDIIGDVTLITVLPGEENADNNFVETLDTCPDDWAQWKFQHPGETADGNPDADRYDNLAEFAFAMPAGNGTGSPWLGDTAWLIRPSTTVPGTLEGVFVRPKGAWRNVTYTLEYADSLAGPLVWASIEIIPLMTDVADNPDCTETVTILDLEDLTGMTGMTGGQGVVRIRADLDEENDDSTDHTSHTEVEGWKETPLELACRTYSNPFLRSTGFTGTVSGVAGQTLDLTGSAGAADLAPLVAGGSYFVEVVSGDNEGHRFDVVSATADSLTLAVDGNLFESAAPYNTFAGALPANLAGDEIVLHRHWSLAVAFPPADFAATNDRATADQVQLFAGGQWTHYWLYDDGVLPPRWVKSGDNTYADQGTSVLAPGQGMFINKRQSPASVLAYGEVRENDFIRPLAPGSNLVSGGYPLDQSAAGRSMTVAGGFFGSRDIATADSFFVWKGDDSLTATGYVTYFLNDNAPRVPSVIKWARVGDASLIARDVEIIILGNRSIFIRSKDGLTGYRVPSPWTP